MMNVKRKIVKHNTPEWQPINPCIDCDYDGIMNQTCPYNPDCFDSSEYYAKIAAQRKLLEHLRDVALITPEAYQSPKTIVTEMLKQLGIKQ